MPKSATQPETRYDFISNKKTTWKIIVCQTYLNFEAYSYSIEARSFINCPYFSKKSIPFNVWSDKLSYWSCNKKTDIIKKLKKLKNA